VLKINYYSLDFTFIVNNPLRKLKSRFHCIGLQATGLEEGVESYKFSELTRIFRGQASYTFDNKQDSNFTVVLHEIKAILGGDEV
jgi:hypothetical protein